MQSNRSLEEIHNGSSEDFELDLSNFCELAWLTIDIWEKSKLLAFNNHLSVANERNFQEHDHA